ncbi:hypothetical protein [Aureivirga sp. CE67]|uniref:hypothetical protein n=1 Tax=Aureivirga sp. CE67 TaxID=1788983 RepID=UPI0018C8DE92|nr:hypothetical protein [Aureivirga sp. CE67]
MAELNKEIEKRVKIWEQFAKEIGAVYNCFENDEELVLEYKNWEIKLDLIKKSKDHCQSYTRLKVFISSLSNFKFDVHKEDFTATIGKFFGMQDVIVGDTAFDKKFVIRGNNEDKIKELFSNETLRNNLFDIDDFHLEITDVPIYYDYNFPKNIRILFFETYGEIEHIELLRKLFKSIMIVLDYLVTSKSISEKEVLAR